MVFECLRTSFENPSNAFENRPKTRNRRYPYKAGASRKNKITSCTAPPKLQHRWPREPPKQVTNVLAASRHAHLQHFWQVRGARHAAVLPCGVLRETTCFSDRPRTCMATGDYNPTSPHPKQGLSVTWAKECKGVLSADAALCDGAPACACTRPPVHLRTLGEKKAIT